MKGFSWVVSFLAVTATALCSGCSDPVSVDDFVYRCDPAGNDCASGYECLKAGTEYVCGQRASCTLVCALNWACVNGECRCFESCDGRECGDDGCGGSCGTCQNGWWCNAGTCKGDCGPKDCGTDSEGNSCGVCETGKMCNGSGKCVPGAMVSIPGGAFQMGSDFGFSSDEEPVHSVTVKPFEMSRTEVTVRQYKECVDSGVCSLPDSNVGCSWGVSGKENHPVNCVDWNQATAYAMWAGGRLPTEAEWEYAARAGTTGDRYGNVDDIAWYGGNSGYETHAVGQLEPNAFGLHDMLGNVWEWCQDWYHDSYSGAPTDGSAWISRSGSSRVVRGGSCIDGAVVVRAACRSSFDPGYRRDHLLGFRIAKSVP